MSAKTVKVVRINFLPWRSLTAEFLEIPVLSELFEFWRESGETHPPTAIVTTVRKAMIFAVEAWFVRF